jgi:2-phosphosulfolactate phosphatase
MVIEKYRLIEGAEKAKGLAVIIDVFRAFSVACYVFHNGAKKIIAVGSIEKAYRLKGAHPSYVLMGERGGRIQRGFDYGNSPTHIESVSFAGKTVVQTTSAGTQGIDSAKNAEEIITGSFVNASAVIEYIRRKSPKEVSLVAMGEAGLSPADEDELCAGYIAGVLEGRPVDFGAIVERLRGGSGRRLLNPAHASWSPPRDFDLCLDLNRFSFVLRAKRDVDGLAVLSTTKP